MMRVAIYARYSTEMQREASLEDQVRLCKERIAREGWQLVEVFADKAVSGSTTQRPGYQGLIEAVRHRNVDLVLAEAMDRLSRDQEDIAALFKRLRYAGVVLVTLSEGEISELHVGLKGTMNALFLKDLAAKTHRGLRGRVEQGRSGGGLSYGYAILREMDARGEPIRGGRAINPDEAAVVLRIFADYAAGDSPKLIAGRLNAENIAGPRGGTWSQSSINGNRARGTGILNNESYIGKLIWNRLRYGKDPDTGMRRSRMNSEAEVIAIDVPELMIVPQDLWQKAKARQRGLDGHPATGSEASMPRPFWSKRRPRYLFSGLMHCGTCGGGFSKISAAHFGCSTARNKGSAVCTNLLTIRQDVLERTVLEGLTQRMMDPEIFQVFVQRFTQEWNRQQSEVNGERDARQAELVRIRQQIERLIDALANGTPPSVVNGRLTELMARQTMVEEQLATMAAPAPRLHPNLAKVYRTRIAGLAEALLRADAPEAREEIRAVVERIDMIDVTGRLEARVRGRLLSILALCGVSNDEGLSVSAEALVGQIKLVAGTGFEPVTFRL